MSPARPRLLLARRLPASEARRLWVRLLQAVADDGRPVELTRRRRRSVFLVRAADFEAGLGPQHPWSCLRARLAPGRHRPNGLNPGVTHRWTHLSSTRARDRLGEALELADVVAEPLLITRQGRSGLMLVAVRLMEQHWNGTAPEGAR